MLIVTTRLRLRSYWYLPPFVLASFLSMWQCRRANGNRAATALRDAGRVFWTMTAWDNLEDMNAFVYCGRHAQAIPRLPGWCDEATFVSWEHPGETVPEDFPNWSEAHTRLRERGTVYSVPAPSPRHAARDFPAPRT